jgi:AcrR family transcriptional regulator
MRHRGSVGAVPDIPTTPKRGRPAAASRDDVLAAAMQRYLRGERVDVQAIALGLGLGRATVYRWFGGRDGLMGEVLARAADPLLDMARAEARGQGGRALLDTFDRFNRGIIGAPALRQYVEQEREAALRVITSGAGVVEPHLVRRIAELIEEQVSRGAYEPPVEPEILAYAIVRLAEAFLFSDVAAGLRGDVDRLRDVEAALLGVSSRPHRPRPGSRAAAPRSSGTRIPSRSRSSGGRPA